MRLYWLMLAATAVVGSRIALADSLDMSPSFVTEKVALSNPELAMFLALCLCFLAAWGLQNRASSKSNEKLMDRFEVLHAAALALQRETHQAHIEQATLCHGEQRAFREEIHAHRVEFTQALAEHRRETHAQMERVRQAVDSTARVNQKLLERLEQGVPS